MRIVVLDGHPDTGSYGEAPAGWYLEGATRGGHDIRALRLRELEFDPILHGGFTNRQPPEPALVDAQDAVRWGTIRKLMKGRSARVIYTQDSPQWLAILAREDLFWRNLRQGFLGHCGFRPVRRTVQERESSRLGEDGR